MENKKFEIPELVIVYFEGDLATDDILTTSKPGGPGEEYEW